MKTSSLVVLYTHKFVVLPKRSPISHQPPGNGTKTKTAVGLRPGL